MQSKGALHSTGVPCVGCVSCLQRSQSRCTCHQHPACCISGWSATSCDTLPRLLIPQRSAAQHTHTHTHTLPCAPLTCTRLSSSAGLRPSSTAWPGWICVYQLNTCTPRAHSQASCTCNQRARGCDQQHEQAAQPGKGWGQVGVAQGLGWPRWHVSHKGCTCACQHGSACCAKPFALYCIPLQADASWLVHPAACA